MNEKCKYCNYVSKCSQFCEYNSVICKLLRSFPKIVDKSYEELEKENQQLKSQLKQRDEVINEVKNTINKMITVGYSKGTTGYFSTGENSEFGCRAKIILDILNKYKDEENK